MNVLKGALMLYNKLFNNLVKSISNSAKSCEGAMLFTDDGKSIHYQQGKVDAYRELANRILKERKLTLQEFEFDPKLSRSLALVLRGRQIDSLEKIIPDNKVRGNYEKYREKQKIAVCFSQEMVKSFELGMKFAKIKSDPEYKDMTEEELYKRLLECSPLSKEALAFIEKRRNNQI